MRNLLSANLLRLRQSLVFWAALIASAGFAGFMVWAQIRDLQDFGIAFTLDEVFFGYAMLIGLFLAIVVTMFLGADYSDGTIRNKLAVVRRRRDVYLANLITVTGACILCCGAFMVTATAITFPFEGFFTQNWKLILTALIGSLLMGAAYCAIYTAISMNCSNKAVTAIVCILLFFALMVAATYVNRCLDAPPEHTTLMMADGEMVTGMEPNPMYLDDATRAVYEFFADLLPTGQGIQYFILSFAHPLRMMLCALATTAVSTLAGLFLFQRKDLK